MRTQRRSSRVSVFRCTPLVAALACALAPAESFAATIQVTNTNDSGTGSLRDAITTANSNCALDSSPVIAFAIRGGGPFVIAPSTPLPQFSCAVGPAAYTPTVDGTTQPGSRPNTRSTPRLFGEFNAVIPVTLDASAQLAYGGDGLVFNSFYGGVLTVKGLELVNFINAISGNVLVKGNYIHVNQVGVNVNGATGSGSAVGGSNPADRNLFQSNTDGVLFSGVNNVSITNNVFSANSHGVEVSSVTTISIAGNQFFNNYSTGLCVSNSTGATATGNFVGAGDTFTNGNAVDGICWHQSTGTIQNNVISGNFGSGLRLFGDGGTNVSFNKIGTDVTGNFALGNGWGVVLDFCYGAQIHDNVISGNMYGGVFVQHDGSGLSSGGSTIFNNKIGTNAAGNAAVANGSLGGVSVNSSNPSTPTSIVNNLISGNVGPGIDLLNSSNVSIVENNIGSSSGGSAPAIPNSDGIATTCGSSVRIQDNLIAGNTGNGITLLGTNGLSPASPNIVANRIGVVGSSTPLPNSGDGIHVGPATCSPASDASGNGFLLNQIANNRGMGITLRSGTGNTLSQNTVYDNVVKNIDINNNYGGPLPNDPLDADTGPNNQQNYPSLTNVMQSAGNTIVSFTLNSTPFRSFHIEAFDNPAMPPIPAGKQYRPPTVAAMAEVMTDGSGNAGGSYTISGLTNFIFLTATDKFTGDTSEFSLVPTAGVSMSAGSLDFGTIAVGTTSAPQSVTLTSTGAAPYHINTFDTQGTCYGGPICVGGDFTCSTTCSTSTFYATGQSCSVTASFHPLTVGSQVSSIFICDNIGSRSITLQGNGLAAGSLAITPATFNFGQVLVGQQGTGHDFVVTNRSTSPTNLGPISITGDFALTNTTCPGQIAANSSCTATLAFAPMLPGPRTGSFSVGGATASLSGTGTQQAVLDMPSTVDFGSLTTGTPATSLSVSLRNSGNAVISFSSISVSGPFTLTNLCPSNLVPGASCTLTLGFNPTTVGDFTGTLTVVSNASGGSRNIPVTAHSVPQPIPLIRVSPGFIGFGDRMIGTQSVAQRIQIRNEGGASAPVDLTTRSTDFLIVGGSCGATIAAQGTCFADIVFQPGGFGGRVGQFRVNSVSTADGQVTDLVGTGCRPFIPGTSRAHQQSNCSP